jgi:hypothetical protein
MKSIQIRAYFVLALAAVGHVIGQSDPVTNRSKGFFIDSSPQGATVYIENDVIGKTPCRFSFELSGQYKLWANKKGYENWSYYVNFNEKSIKSIFFYLVPKTVNSALLRSVMLPGWGQYYSDRKMHSRLMIALQLSSLASLAFAEQYYRNRRSAYNSHLVSYQFAGKSIMQESSAWQQLQRSHDDFTGAHRMRIICAAATFSVYLYNLLDAVVHFPHNFRQIEFMPSTPSANISGFGGRVNVSLSLTH